MSISRRKAGKNSASGFHPPHCPNRECSFYPPKSDWKFRRTGSYTRPSDGASFPAFQCLHCGRNFSSRTFSTTYWLRRRRIFPQVVRLSVNGPGLRQIGRILNISHATVARHLARAGRHCLLLHREILQPLQLQEALVVDGFESFEYSQFHPFHFNLAAGSQSWFLYHFTDSPLRRKGSMTSRQKKIRAELESGLGRPDPQAVEKGMVNLLSPLLRHLRPQGASMVEIRGLEGQVAEVWEKAEGAPPGPMRKLLLRSDDHPAYVRAWRQLRREDPTLVIEHQVTSSKERRTTSNPLFPVNLADLLLRHSEANHRRETIAFSKRRQAAAERLAVFVVWRNMIKRRREKEAGKTAAMVAGVAEEQWSWRRVFQRRLFVRPQLLPDVWREYYWRRVRTAVFGDAQTTHDLKYAF